MLHPQCGQWNGGDVPGDWRELITGIEDDPVDEAIASRLGEVLKAGEVARGEIVWAALTSIPTSRRWASSRTRSTSVPAAVR